MIGSFIYLSHFSGAPPGVDLRARPYRQGRQVRAGAVQVTRRRRLASQRRSGCASRRCRGSLAALDRDGEEARVVGGAVRNALLGEPIGEIDLATTALPDEVIRRATAAGFRAVPTGIEHGTVTVVARRPSVRGDDAAQGHRDVRPPRQGRVRPRLEGRRRAARLHHERAVGDGRRHGARLRRRARRSQGAPRALHRRCRRRALPRTICASCASSAFHAAYGEGAPDAAGL